MPEKINDKKLIALKAQFKEAKTAHIFQMAHSNAKCNRSWLSLAHKDFSWCHVV